MVDYFDTAQMSSALASLTARVTGKAGEVSLYPLLKKATSSNEQPTPGYIYQVLVEFSFESSENSRHLAKYLNTRLQRPSAHGVLKTMKTMKQLVENGSREFRKALRENDEHIKGATDYGSQGGKYIGTEVLEQIRILSQEILSELFDQEAVEADGRIEPEIRPPTGAMAGMGRSLSTSQGRMEGFGSEPVDKSSVIDKARDMLESVVNLPDPKKQIMELCLKDDVGDYEAVRLPGAVPEARRRIIGGVVAGGEVPRQHVPGRAGGGWEDSSDEEQTRLDQLSGSLLTDSLASDNSVSASLEAAIIKEFCHESGTEDIVDRCEETISKLMDGDPMTGLVCLGEVLDSGTSQTQLRALLLLEFLLTRGTPTPSAVATVYEKVYSKLELSEEPKVALKAKKVNMIIKALKGVKTSSDK